MFCLLQADIILAINEEFGTDYGEEAPWHSLFAEDAPNAVSMCDAKFEFAL